MTKLQQKVADYIKEDDNYTVAKIAKALEVKQIDVLLNLPSEVASVANGDKFDEIIKQIETWGDVLVVKNTPNFIMEIKTKISSGSYQRGYYNFSHDAPMSGHLKADAIDKIIFLSAKAVMGMLSHCVLFMDENGDDIFKIYVARDENREFIKPQLEAYLKLKESFR